MMKKVVMHDGDDGGDDDGDADGDEHATDYDE